MLSKRQRTLLTALRDADGWCKSTTLASQLQVTTRTLRNDISGINLEHPELVESSALGYRLSAAVPLPTGLFASDKFAGKQERIAYIISRLLTAHGKLDLYDLADELFVSYQTIEKDSRQVEHELREFGLQLVKRAEHAHVEGSESNRRKLLSRLVYSELNDNLYDIISYYHGFYEDVELYTVKRILCETLVRNSISANEYAINSIVLHLGISINRIRNKQIIGDDIYGHPSQDGYQEYVLAKQVAEELRQQLGVEFPLQEVCNLAFTLLGKTRTQIAGVTTQNLLEYVEPTFVETAKALLGDVREAYGLELYSEDGDVFVRFVYHIRDMVIRVRNHLHIRNPIQDKLKSSYPLLYELGVFMAGKLGELLGLSVNEEEIAFLAIHAGALLENQRQTQTDTDRIRAMLVCPQHLSISTAILQTLQRRYGNDLHFVEPQATTSENYFDMEVDLILSTMPLRTAAKGAWQELVIVDPFPSAEDFRKVDEGIARVRRYRTQRTFAETTRAWFRPDLFCSSDGCQSEWDAIQVMGRRMWELGYVGEDFPQQVARREKLSSTTYGGDFAIPHSTEMNALTTCIAVMLCKEPLPWGDFSVSVVFMIAINHENRHTFAAFYDNLAGLFANPENLHQLYGAVDFDDFVSRLDSILQAQRK